MESTASYKPEPEIRPMLVDRSLKYGLDIDKLEENEVIGKIIDLRESQSKESRLCEYVTGVRMEDNKIFDKLGEDQLRVRAKYGLPSREYKFENLSSYHKYLENLAKINEVSVVDRSACGKFFEENTFAGAVFLNETKTIGVNIDRSSEDNYARSLSDLEHETIHSIQDKFFPSMPIEVQEYEAYVANWNIDYLRENPEALDVVFGFGVGDSVNSYYREMKEDGHDLGEPVWKRADFFLENVDGIDGEEIAKYRELKKESEKVLE